MQLPLLVSMKRVSKAITTHSVKAASTQEHRHQQIPAVTEAFSPAISAILASGSSYKPLEVADIPDYVVCNPLWLRLASSVETMYLIMRSDRRTVLLLKLREEGVEVVMKGYSAQHAAVCDQQIAAEINSARRFSGHPLLATVLATSYDEFGNFCSVTPYAGCSLYNLVKHPLWKSSTTVTERLQFFRHVAVHCLTAHAFIQEKPESAHIYRDTKPENIAIDLSSGQVKVLDMGLAISASKEDYFKAFTVGYFTPEIAAAGPDWMHDNFFEYENRKACTNTSMDVFLLSFVGLDMVLGLPAELQTSSYNLNSQDPQSGEELLVLLDAHSEADYAPLINSLPDPEAREFFTRTLCRDPAERPTPAQALKLPWLSGSVPAVQQSVAAAVSAYQQRNQLVLDLLDGVEGAFVAPPQQQHAGMSRSSSPSSSSSSLDSPVTPSVCSSNRKYDSFSSQCSVAEAVELSSHVKDRLAEGQASEAKAKRPGLMQKGKHLWQKLTSRGSNSGRKAVSHVKDQAQAQQQLTHADDKSGEQSYRAEVHTCLCGLWRF